MVSHLGHVTMTSFPVVRLNLRNRDPLVWSFLAKPCWDTLCSHACNLMWKDLASFLWISRTFLNSKYFAYLHTSIQLPNSDTPSNLHWWAQLERLPAFCVFLVQSETAPRPTLRTPWLHKGINHLRDRRVTVWGACGDEGCSTGVLQSVLIHQHICLQTYIPKTGEVRYNAHASRV